MSAWNLELRDGQSPSSGFQTEALNLEIGNLQVQGFSLKPWTSRYAISKFAAMELHWFISMEFHCFSMKFHWLYKWNSIDLLNLKKKQWNYIVFSMEFNWFVQWMSIYLFNNIKPFVLFWKNNWIPLCFNCIPLFVFQWNSIDWFCSMEFHCFWTWTNQWHCIVAFFNWIQLIVSIEFRCFWCSMEFHWFFEFENTSMEFDCLLIEFHWFVSMESHWCFSIEFHWFVWIWKKQWMSIDFVFFSIEFHLFSMKVHWVLFCVSIDFHCVFFSCFCYLKTPMDFQWVCFSGIPLFFQHNSIAVFCSLEFHCVFFLFGKHEINGNTLIVVNGIPLIVPMEFHWVVFNWMALICWIWKTMEFHWLCSMEFHWCVK